MQHSHIISSLDHDHLSIDGYQSWDISTVYQDYNEEEIPAYIDYLTNLANATTKAFNELFEAKGYKLELREDSIRSPKYYNYTTDNCEYNLYSPVFDSDLAMLDLIELLNSSEANDFTTIKFEYLTAL